MDSNNKISIRQTMVIFFIAIASPIIRVIPRFSAEIAQEASWVMPIVGIIFFIILLYILNAIIGKKNNHSLEDVFYDVFGKLIGKTIILVYIIWTVLLIAIYLRYFADRMTASIFISTPNRFFIATMSALIYIVVRKDIKFFARYIEFFSVIFVVFLFLSFFVAIPNVKIINLLPVDTTCFIPILKSSFPLMGMLAYITFMFFLGDKISDKENFKKHIKKISIAIFLMSLIVILMTVGPFGYKLTQQFNLPFFMFFKSIELLNIVERIESVLITFWTVTDFCIITTFTYIAMKLIKKNFNLKSSKQIITPLLFITYILALFICTNIFEMKDLSLQILIPGNVIMGIVVPIILLIVGKIRKKI